MLSLELDHVALGLPSVAAAEPFLEGTLRGRKAGGHDGLPFGFVQWVFAGGGRIEVIHPTGSDGFLHRFLARGGPRIHHLTFKVGSLDAMLERAGSMGYAITGEDRADPHWQEAFLHPKQALGIVIQLVEQSPRPGGHEIGAVPPAPDAARVRGPRLVAPSAEAARRQWRDLLGGQEARDGEALVFAWPRSPLTITVDIDAAARPGAVAIEVSAERDLGLPSEPITALGTRFVQR